MFRTTIPRTGEDLRTKPGLVHLLPTTGEERPGNTKHYAKGRSLEELAFSQQYGVIPPQIEGQINWSPTPVTQPQDFRPTYVQPGPYPTMPIQAPFQGSTQLTPEMQASLWNQQQPPEISQSVPLEPLDQAAPPPFFQGAQPGLQPAAPPAPYSPPPAPSRPLQASYTPPPPQQSYAYPPPPVEPVPPPAVEVAFDLGAYGMQQVNYHAVLFCNGFIVTVFNRDFKYAQRYLPPPGATLAIRIVDTSDNAASSMRLGSFHVRTTPFNFDFEQYSLSIFQIIPTPVQKTNVGQFARESQQEQQKRQEVQIPPNLHELPTESLLLDNEEDEDSPAEFLPDPEPVSPREELESLHNISRLLDNVLQPRQPH